jgi:hypothetical protein
VSTIDTNEYSGASKKNSENLNFLTNSHKRTKKCSSRYFADERVSLPQIKSSTNLSNNKPFGMKKTSCARKLDVCFESLAGLSSNNDFYKSLVQFSNEGMTENNWINEALASHYYYDKEIHCKPISIEFMNSMVLQPINLSTSKVPSSKRKTRNFNKFIANTEDSIGLKKTKIFEEMGKRFFKNSNKTESSASDFINDSERGVNKPKGLNLFSSTKSVKDSREIPSTPSFALRKDKS